VVSNMYVMIYIFLEYVYHDLLFDMYAMMNFSICMPCCAFQSICCGVVFMIHATDGGNRTENNYDCQNY